MEKASAMFGSIKAQLSRRRLVRVRRSIAVQLYVGLGGAVAVTLAASAVGWMTFNQVGNEQARVNDRNVPDMAAAFTVAQRIGALVDTAPRLTVASSEAEFESVRAEIGREREAFEARLDELGERRGQSEGVRRVRVWGRAMTTNIEAIEQSEIELLRLGGTLDAQREQIRTVSGRLSQQLETLVDDQFFFAMTGYRDLESPPMERSVPFLDSELDRFRQIAALKEGAAIGDQILASLFSVSHADRVIPLRERYEAASSQIGRSLAALADDERSQAVAANFEELFNLTFTSGGVFETRSEQLEMETRQAELLAENREVASNLITEIESLVSVLSSGTLASTRSSSETVRTGRNLLLAMNLFSVASAVMIGWLFIGRHLLSRLERLSTRMRRMAMGDLESKVEREGTDEIAEMAEALEVFRRHSLEVQRLNLVEELAEDLSDKNAKLESALADLRKAQDQIVMREKLAALGELTAGVAHEIKNPLNFVKNFAEVSEELLEELQELLPDPGEPVEEEDQEEVDDLMDDLAGNLQLIRQHGERADAIVRDMLMMGRGSDEKRPTNLNSLVREHANLAYHSARATDADFQLHIEQDYDERLDTTEVEVVPQDVGRVVLNMVGNACHATDDKRRSGVEMYLPTLQLSTRLDTDKVQIRIRDNGCGMPDDVVEKIFNPFFTTKPTDKGTGLGLALSNDIVRKHGGRILVDTEPGEGTQMTVEIPTAPGSAGPALDA